MVVSRSFVKRAASLLLLLLTVIWWQHRPGGDFGTAVSGAQETPAASEVVVDEYDDVDTGEEVGVHQEIKVLVQRPESNQIEQPHTEELDEKFVEEALANHPTQIKKRVLQKYPLYAEFEQKFANRVLTDSNQQQAQHDFLRREENLRQVIEDLTMIEDSKPFNEFQMRRMLAIDFLSHAFDDTKGQEKEHESGLRSRIESIILLDNLEDGSPVSVRKNIVAEKWELLGLLRRHGYSTSDLETRASKVSQVLANVVREGNKVLTQEGAKS